MNQPGNQLSDEQLYQQMADGPERPFRELYNRYSGPLLRYVFRFTGNTEAAEEILHDVFAQLLAGKFQVQQEASLKNWLYTLAKNKSLNLQRKSAFERQDDAAVTMAAASEDLEAQVIQSGLLKKLALAENLLPADLQQTWNLRKQGLDHQQIAARLLIPVGTVKSRFHRLVQHLRKEWNHESINELPSED